MAQKTGNEETEFKVAPSCINSRAATKTPPPETPPQLASSSSPSPLTSSSHNQVSSSPSPSLKSFVSASSRSSPVMTSESSHKLTSSSSLSPPASSSPWDKSPSKVMSSSSSPSHPSSSPPVLSGKCSQLTSSSPATLTSPSPVVKLGDPSKEKRRLFADEEEASLSMPMKRKVNRCSGCSKKVGLTGFRCRCGQLFCSDHRYSDRHDCSFDYKSAGREAIARENPVIKAAKILKI